MIIALVVCACTPQLNAQWIINAQPAQTDTTYQDNPTIGYGFGNFRLDYLIGRQDLQEM